MNKDKQLSPTPLALLLCCCLGLFTATTAAALDAIPSDAASCVASLNQPLIAPNTGFESRLRLLNWNIEKTESPGWGRDLATMGANRELLLIQEAVVQAGISQILPQRLYQSFASGYSRKDLETGVLTLSTVEPSLLCHFTAWEPWLGTPKATSVTEFPLQGSSQRLLVINMHAVNFTVGLEDYDAQIRVLEPLLAAHRGPLIVAGDFNTWSEARLDHLNYIMSKHQLTATPFSPDARTRFWGLALDHVFLRGITVIDAKAIPVKTSDHNPLLLSLEIDPQ